MMNRSEGEVMTQLATRIPKRLHHDVKVHCVEVGQSIADFVIAAMQERLRQQARARRKA
jgi:hypothetical protein